MDGHVASVVHSHDHVSFCKSGQLVMPTLHLCVCRLQGVFAEPSSGLHSSYPDRPPYDPCRGFLGRYAALHQSMSAVLFCGAFCLLHSSAIPSPIAFIWNCTKTTC